MRLLETQASDSCDNIRPVLRKPGHSRRPVYDAFEGVPGEILQRVRLKSLRRILDKVMQALVPRSALERFCDCGAGPPMPGQIDNAWHSSLVEPRRGIEFETDDIIGRMARRVNHGVLRFARADRMSLLPNPNEHLFNRSRERVRSSLRAIG